MGLPDVYEWDYIKLSDTRSRRSFQELFSKDNLSLVSYGFKVPIGTGAQVVSKNGAEKLLAATEVFSRPIDVELQWQSIEKLTTLGIRPPPFKIRHLKSDIDNFGSRKKTKTRFLVRTYRQVLFKLLTLKKYMKSTG